MLVWVIVGKGAPLVFVLNLLHRLLALLSAIIVVLGTPLDSVVARAHAFPNELVLLIVLPLPRVRLTFPRMSLVVPLLLPARILVLVPLFLFLYWISLHTYNFPPPPLPFPFRSRTQSHRTPPLPPLSFFFYTYSLAQ